MYLRGVRGSGPGWARLPEGGDLVGMRPWALLQGILGLELDAPVR